MGAFLRRLLEKVLATLAGARAAPSSDERAVSRGAGKKEETVMATDRQGSKGEAVKQIQERLKALGHRNRAIDGDFDTGSDANTKSPWK